MKTREALFEELRSAFKRAERFRDRMDDPELFGPVQAAEFFMARDKSEKVIQKIFENYPGEWSEDEQKLLRPI